MDIIAVPKASSEPLPELAEFLAPFAHLFRRRASRQALERYGTGLLTDLARKNCDTIAAAVAGTSTERLQHLLTDAAWDHLALDAARVRWLSSRSPHGGILLLDDSGFAKQGQDSVGVARQYSGTLGRVGNCQVVVSAEYVADAPESRRPLHWPVSAQVYLPEAWADDPARRKRAHVPADVAFQTKPEIALTLVERAGSWGVPFDVVVADAGYGDNPQFLAGLEARGRPYVCAVESSFGVRRPDEVRAAAAAGPPPYGGKGQPPKPRPAPLYSAATLIGALPETAWQPVEWRTGTKGALGQRMVAVRVHRATGNPRHSTSHSRVSTGPEGWLLAERPREPTARAADETQYYFAWLPAETPIERLAQLAHARWAIEQFYEDAKGECGLDDYQGRRWDGLHRHLALAMLSYSFLVTQSVTTSEPAAASAAGFFPLHPSPQPAGHPPARPRLAPRGPGALVHPHRPDHPLSPAPNLTK